MPLDVDTMNSISVFPFKLTLAIYAAQRDLFEPINNVKMAQELQSSILTCISSNFKTGNVAKDVILLSAYTTAVTLLFSQGPGCVKSAYVYIKDKMSSAKLGNGAPKITIQSTGFFNLKYGKWIYTESEEYNNHLIYAIQNRIKSSDKVLKSGKNKCDFLDSERRVFSIRTLQRIQLRYLYQIEIKRYTFDTRIDCGY